MKILVGDLRNIIFALGAKLFIKGHQPLTAAAEVLRILKGT